jgi:hypothetical protein
MSPGGTPDRAGASPCGRGGGEVGPQEPALQGPGGGKGFTHTQTTEHHADQPRSPGRMLTSEFEHPLHEGGVGLWRRHPAPVMRGGQRVGELGPKALNQASNRTGRKTQRVGNGRSLLPVSEADPDGLTHGKGYGGWHGPFSRDDGRRKPVPTVNAFGMRSNFVSRFRGPSLCRVTYAEPVKAMALAARVGYNPWHPTPLTLTQVDL